MTNALREQTDPQEFQEFKLPASQPSEKVTQGMGEAAALATVTVLHPEITDAPTGAQEIPARRSLNFMNLNPGYGDTSKK